MTGNWQSWLLILWVIIMNISAVIPCYNGDRFLQEAVESINTQTYLPREIIIVNDGSNDESERVIEQLKASSQVPITSVNQVNHGVSAARNVGIATASSDWIAFLDVDDLWLPTMLESKVKFAEAQGLTSGLICCNYYVDAIDDANKKHNDSRYAQSIHDRVMQSEEFQSILLKENFIGTATTMMFSRKDALLVGGFDSFLKHSEEFDFILRFACNSKVAVLSKPLALKRHHGDNLSNDKELYFYSHYFSCKRNVLYKDKYSRVCFSSKIRGLMQRDLEKFATGYCNQIFEKKKSSGLIVYVKFYSDMRTLMGFLNHSLGFLKKIIRTISFGLARSKR